MKHVIFKNFVVTALASMVAASAGFAQDAPAEPPADRVPAGGDSPLIGNEITPELQDGVRRGLAFLAGRQQPSGMIGSSYSTASTSLSALALMAAGNLPGRGEYGVQVQRALDFILASSQDSGLLVDNGGHGAMYAHGFATLFLAEVYGMSPDDRVRDALERAVRLIERSQNREGGWRYTPAPLDADVSVTICQVMALRAARDAGIKVEKNVIDRAVEYVKKCQNPDGGFNYTLQGGGSQFPRSAAGVATLYYAGVYEGDEIERGLEYVMRSLPSRGRGDDGHYFYGQYYAVQTMFLAGGDYWAKWFPAIREELLARQGRDGSWTGDISAEYGTAMACIILQMPNRYLPVFSGKGDGS